MHGEVPFVARSWVKCVTENSKIHGQVLMVATDEFGKAPQRGESRGRLRWRSCVQKFLGQRCDMKKTNMVTLIGEIWVFVSSVPTFVLWCLLRD